MSYFNFDADLGKAAFGKIAGLNPPGSSGASSAAFGALVNTTPLTPAYTGAQTQAVNPYPQGSNESMLWMMKEMQRDAEERGDRKYGDLYDKITKQRQEEAREAFTWKTLGQIPAIISSAAQNVTTNLYNPERLRIMSETPRRLAEAYAIAGRGNASSQRYIS